MTKRGRRSEKAKQQRASGKPGFDSGFVDDPFASLLDADFELDSQIDEEEDSELDIPANGFTLSQNMVLHGCLLVWPLLHYSNFE